jgi:OFA family oxalate/formate antiporter-like MFS transporter
MGILPSFRPPFHGWVIVTASLIITTLTYGVYFSFGVFLEPLQEEFEWTRAMISLVPGLFIFVQCIVGLFAGWLTDKHGPGVIVGVGGFLAGLGLVLTSRLTAAWQIYIYYSFLVGFGVGCVGAPIFATVSRWFVKQRGLALGIVTSGMGLGNIVVVPIARQLISEYSWQTSYLVIGCASWTIILVALALKKQPEPARQLPDGRDVPKAIGSGGPEGLTLVQALQTSTLWLLLGALVLAFASLMMVFYHLVAYAEDSGIAEMRAAMLLSVIGATSIIGRILTGIGSDRFGRRLLFAMCLLLQGLMMFWLIKSTSILMLYVFAGVWGFGYGGWMPLQTAMTVDLFGMRDIGGIFGLTGLSYGIGGTIGPVLAGYVVDATGSYSLAFLIGALAVLLSAAIVTFLKAPKTH